MPVKARVLAQGLSARPQPKALLYEVPRERRRQDRSRIKALYP
nr:hypothetical protein [Enterobacter asburiae]